MKEKIYTIPLSEAFEKESECPFCALYDTLEKNALNYTLGPSYMEPDNRILTNKKGFCREHYNKMYAESNRLGLALMLYSHYDEILSGYDSWYDSLKEVKGGFFRKKVCLENPANELEKTCFICDKVNAEMEKFYDTFVYLWKRDKDFRNKVLESRSFCINHFDRILNIAKTNLSDSEFNDFFAQLYEKQKEDLVRVKDELDWFIKKFDYRFSDEPWKNSKTALKRSIVKIASLNVEPDEN